MREAEFRAAIADWSLPAPHRRFGIYRNNVASALINALRVRYPVTESLVGREFFAAMAGIYCEANRPASPVLIGYGDGLADFIAGFSPAGSVPYLADVARLESLWWRAYHAADVAPLAPQAFAAVPAETWGDMRFTFHPSLGLLASPFAVGAIWRAHKGGPPMAEIDTTRPDRVLVVRPHTGVEVRSLAPAGHGFLSALLRGERLADAFAAAASTHPDFDLPAELRGLIALNIITGIAP